MNAVSPLIEGLNDIQTEAVLHTEGPVLIVAGILVGPTGLAAVVLYALAGVMVGTSAAGACPTSFPTCSLAPDSAAG